MKDEPVNSIHPVLARQLRKAGITDRGLPVDSARFADLVRRVSSAYTSADFDRYLLERSIDLSSFEMKDLNEQLKKDRNPRWSPQNRPMVVTSKPANRK